MKTLMLLLAVLFGSTQMSLGQTQTDNAALTKLFEVDQAARKAKTIDWQKLNSEDEIRRQQVHGMLQAGELHTGTDYFHAALIYQHGQKHGDFLLAHVLAVEAVGLGNANARWLAAATLDRYLLSVSQPQIYGTQFESGPEKPTVWKQRTIDAQLISDSMRRLSCVVSVEEQGKILNEVNRGEPFRSTNLQDCH